MGQTYPELVRWVITYGLGRERVSSFSTMLRPSADTILTTSFGVSRFTVTCSQPISPVFGDGVRDGLLLTGTEEGLQVGGTGSFRRTSKRKIFIDIINYVKTMSSAHSV